MQEVVSTGWDVAAVHTARNRYYLSLFIGKPRSAQLHQGVHVRMYGVCSRFEQDMHLFLNVLHTNYIHTRLHLRRYPL